MNNYRSKSCSHEYSGKYTKDTTAYYKYAYTNIDNSGYISTEYLYQQCQLTVIEKPIIIHNAAEYTEYSYQCYDN